MDEFVKRAHSEKTAAILAVQSTALNSITSFLHSRGFVQMMPVMLSPITDPLCHSVFDAGIDYCGQHLQLTKSMILHKQIAVGSPHLGKIFIVSPNVRLEKPECGKLGRYLIEFSQVDMEMRAATKGDFMRLAESLFAKVVGDVLAQRQEELQLLGRKLRAPKTPFPVFESKEWRAKLGKDFEAQLSLREQTPFWVMDHEREFYDKEDATVPGYYHNYDLFYPEGFGEGLSGAERDFEHGVLERKIMQRGQRQEDFGAYLSLAKGGHLAPSAGGGLGVERLVRYLCGLEHIRNVSPFAKVPGEKYVV